jgi:hypothetical protein
MQYSTLLLVASMNKLVSSARNPPLIYINAIMNGIVVPSNYSG